MFNYFTISIIMSCLLIFILMLTILSDEILEKRNILFSTFALVCILIAIFNDWIIKYIEISNTGHNDIVTFAVATAYFICPTVPILISWSLDSHKSKKNCRFLFCVIIYNFIISYSAMFTNKVFYYTSKNIFKYGDFYFLYVISMILGVGILLYNFIKVSRVYQNKNNYIILLIFIIIVYSIVFHITGIANIFWFGCVFSLSMLHIYFSSLVNQIDTLTKLLNRKCYDNKLYDIKSEAIIIILDVDKFKYINDTYGHNFGDVCLIEIANTIKRCYGQYGYCYRIGGDEFCVILEKKLEDVEFLNSEFNTQIKLINLSFTPTVSIGYSYYNPLKSSIIEAIENADSMMYSIKKINY